MLDFIVNMHAYLVVSRSTCVTFLIVAAGACHGVFLVVVFVAVIAAIDRIRKDARNYVQP